ncbi:universal stress protein [Nonomuraea sp. CA-143628]|uniref:universal stress protein n=1 Tax=Nonomuraea sp. CA-143628 TaxID=3239997 RepID=UPI003D910D4D
MKDDLGVVVGYESSGRSLAALRWAAAEATARKVPLTVCHAWEWPYHEWPGELVPYELVRRPVQRLLKRAADWAARHYPALPVNTLSASGTPAALLADLSREASLVVVEANGGGALAGLVARSVSLQVATHAWCPVIIVRGDSEALSGREVVAGFDGSPASVEALALAAGEADRLGVRLKVLIARETGVPPEGLAWEEIAPLQHAYPELKVEVEQADEPARPALLEAARRAGLLVVGARGLGQIRGLLLGSVSQAMARHAPCSVAVVHRRDRAEFP